MKHSLLWTVCLLATVSAATVSFAQTGVLMRLDSRTAKLDSDYNRRSGRISFNCPPSSEINQVICSWFTALNIQIPARLDELSREAPDERGIIAKIYKDQYGGEWRVSLSPKLSQDGRTFSMGVEPQFYGYLLNIQAKGNLGKPIQFNFLGLQYSSWTNKITEVSALLTESDWLSAERSVNEQFAMEQAEQRLENMMSQPFSLP